MRIYIVRHGETIANAKGLFQGWTDDPLNKNGILLAEITGKKIPDVHFDACFTSPLIRAKKTAEIILQESGNGKTPIFIDDRIKEINFGDWENKCFRGDEREVDEELIQLFFNDPFRLPQIPNGESIRQVCDRTQEFLQELLLRDDGKNYLVSTHGCALRAMLNYLYDNKDDYWHGHVPYNCVVNIVEGINGRGKLIGEDIVYYDSELVVDQYKNY